MTLNNACEVDLFSILIIGVKEGKNTWINPAHHGFGLCWVEFFFTNFSTD